MENYFQIQMDEAQVNAISNLALAHIGDAVYELMCRSHLCLQGGKTVQRLHRQTVEMVNAPAQARFVQKLLPHLTAQEQDFYRRGKNTHSHAAPKAATAKEYAQATGLETLFGALYLLGRTQRLNELFALMMQPEEDHGL